MSVLHCADVSAQGQLPADNPFMFVVTSFSPSPSRPDTTTHPQISLFFCYFPHPLVVADLQKPVLEPREASGSERALRMPGCGTDGAVET